MSTSIGLPGPALAHTAPCAPGRDPNGVDHSDFGDLLSPGRMPSDPDAEAERERTSDRIAPVYVGLLPPLPPIPHGEVRVDAGARAEAVYAQTRSIDASLVPLALEDQGAADTPPAVMVLESETHLEPARPLMVFQTLTDELTREAAALRGAEVRPTAPRADAPVRTLSIELRPADLGVLHVRMRVVSGRLELSFDASRPEAARWLGAQTMELAGLLRSAGYDLSEIDIKVAFNGHALPLEPQPDRNRGAVRSVEQRHGAIEERQRLRRMEPDDVVEGVVDRDGGGVYL